ncbi:MAG: FlgD immunoglobulin-like domain containing protein [Candidatus Latescibacterota bacterium]
MDHPALAVTCLDTLTDLGGIDALRAVCRAVGRFGDVDANGSVQAYDAARVLWHCLSPHLQGVDSLAGNVDLQAPVGPINPFDAALVLQRVVALIPRFPVQQPAADNHPQPQTAHRPRAAVEERHLALHAGIGWLAVSVDRRDGIVPGEMTIAGVTGRVTMAPEMAGFLTASVPTADGLRIVFAGAAPVEGPGELLRVRPGVGTASVKLVRAAFNEGGIVGQAGDAAAEALPDRFALSAARPNPFNPSTTLDYSVSVAGNLLLAVYDITGQQVRVLHHGPHAAGRWSAQWDARDDQGRAVASGTYLCRLRAGSFEQVARLVLVR